MAGVVTGMPVRQDGLMAVPVPAGRVDLHVDWTTTPDVVLGRVISGLALLLVTVLGLREYLAVAALVYHEKNAS